MNEEAVPKNTKMATKFGVTVINGTLVRYFISQASYSKAKNENTMRCLRKLSSTKITMKTMTLSGKKGPLLGMAKVGWLF